MKNTPSELETLAQAIWRAANHASANAAGASKLIARSQESDYPDAIVAAATAMADSAEIYTTQILKSAYVLWKELEWEREGVES
jgi:hypothetical protein